MDLIKAKTKEIAENTYLIDYESEATAYLVVGKDKALVIDTGIGFYDLLSFVKSKTNLPIILANTHGHGDHVGGNHQFVEAYMSMEDIELYNAEYSPAEKRKYAVEFKDEIPASVTSEEIEE